MTGVITVSEPSWIAPFTGLSPRQFGKLVTVLRREGADAVRRGRLWSLPLEDRALLVAAYWRTNLTMRQLAPLFGVSKVGGRPDHRPPRADARPPAPQTIREEHRAHRGRNPRPHPRPHHRRAVEELQVLHQPPGRHRRLHPPGRRGRSAARREPQRLQGMGGIRCQGRRRQDHHDRPTAATRAPDSSSRTAASTARPNCRPGKRNTTSPTSRSEPASSTSSPA